MTEKVLRERQCSQGEKSTTRQVYRKVDHSMRAPFITFEGSEGCGKSTQVARLIEHLKNEGVDLFVTREPGGTAIGESIRQLLQFAPEAHSMKPETEVLLFAASRAQLVREMITPAVARGCWVVADRFADSTTVYQGAARGLGIDAVAMLNQFAVADCRPDATFYIAVDVEIAQRRMVARGSTKADRMEQQPLEFYQRVERAYRDLAAVEPKRIIVIDGAANPDDVEQQIWTNIVERFGKLLPSRR